MDEFIHAEIDVEAAVRAVRRGHHRVEDQIKDVGVVVPADPSPRVGLKVSFLDIGAESCGFVGLDRHLDSDFLQLLLEYGAQSALGFVRGSLEPEGETGFSGLAQQFAGALGVVGIRLHIRRITPVADGNHSRGRSRLFAPEILDDGFSIDGVSDGLAHADIRERGILHVEGDVLIDRAWRIQGVQVRIVLQDPDHVGRQHVEGDIRRSLSQLQRAHDGFRHNLENDRRDFWFVAVVTIVALEHDLAVRHIAHELELAGTDRLETQIGLRALRHDADAASG